MAYSSDYSSFLAKECFLLQIDHNATRTQDGVDEIVNSINMVRCKATDKEAVAIFATVK